MDSLQKLIHLYESFQNNKHEVEQTLRQTFELLSKRDSLGLLRDFEKLIKKREHVMTMLTFQENKLGVSFAHQKLPIGQQIEMLTFFLLIGRDVLGHETSQ